MPLYETTLLCESVRIEANNKISLLGVYGRVIYVPTIPTTLGSLSIFQRWLPTVDEIQAGKVAFTGQLLTPGSPPAEIPEQQIPVPPGPLPMVSLTLQLQGFPVKEAGDYHFISFSKGVLIFDYVFQIIKPTEEERKKLNLVGFG